MIRAILCLAFLLGSLGRPVVSSAQEEPGPAGLPGDDLRVYLVTFGVGDAVWEKFGHNALRIVNRATGTDIAWEWGIFDFNQQGFIPRLMKGTMMYNMGWAPYDSMLARYRAADRDAWSQELNLTAGQKWALQEAVLANWDADQGQYRYDYYRDNCSTRIRDHLDAVLGGQLRAALAPRATEHGYRWHTRRLLQGEALSYAGIQLVLGNRAEEPITVWDEGFLPLRLMHHLRSVLVVDEEGEELPLVGAETRILSSASRQPAPPATPVALPWFLLLGIVWGGMVVALSFGPSRGLAVRVATVALAGGWSLLAGVGGTVLLAAWAFTDHVFWGWNENVAQVDPLSLLVAVGLATLVVRPSLPPWVSVVAKVVAAASVVGVALQVLPGFDQVNGEIMAATVPLNLAVAWAVGRWCRVPAGAPEGEGGPPAHSG